RRRRAAKFRRERRGDQRGGGREARRVPLVEQAFRSWLRFRTFPAPSRPDRVPAERGGESPPEREPEEMMSSALKQMVLVVVVFAASFFVPTLRTAAPAGPDEGMWTFDNLPLEHLKKTYGFEPTKEWIDHVRVSSIKFAQYKGGQEVGGG